MEFGPCHTQLDRPGKLREPHRHKLHVRCVKGRLPEEAGAVLETSKCLKPLQPAEHFATRVHIGLVK